MNKFNPFESLLTYMKRQFTTFDMSNFHQTSAKLGRLNVNRVDFVLPSDYWKGSTSLAIKVAPLVAPAFTRIKALVNSFYVSYPQVWNYWNQFISNRPSDSYLSSTNTAKYAGRYVEPFIPFQFVALICKIVKGYIKLETINLGGSLDYIVSYCNNIGDRNYFVWKYDIVNGRRRWLVSLRPDVSTVNADSYFGGSSSNFISFGTFVPNSPEFSNNGFNDALSFFYHLCKESYENLKSFGIPVDVIASTEFEYYEAQSLNVLPFFAYSKIWQDFFRNSQVQGSELDYRESNGIAFRAFKFSSNNFVKVDTSIQNDKYGNWKLRIADLPPSGYDSVTPYVSFTTSTQATQSGTLYLDYSQAFSLLVGFRLNSCVQGKLSISDVAQIPQYYNGLLLPKYRNFDNDIFTSAAIDPMQGSPSLAVPSTIEELRSQSKLEEFLERNTAARNFYDFIRAHFGTHAESVSNQRCKLLGTQSVNVNISEQLQSSQTTEGEHGSPLGERAGVAEGFGSTYTLSNNFQEHGVIITTLSFVIDSQYFQGLPEIFEHHKDWLDYPWPEFANLGLESISSSMLYFGLNSNDRYSFSSNDDLTIKGNGNNSIHPNTSSSSGGSSIGPGIFGYTPRYSKYKLKLDQLSGEFTTSLDFWNTFREFFSAPKLCHAFISYQDAVFMSNLNRIFAVDDELADKFYVDMYNDYSVSRCLPLVANPTLD